MRQMHVISGLLWLSGLLYITYFLPRTEFAPLLVTYAAAFGTYLYLALNPLTPTQGWLWAISARLLLIAAVPNLSDDVYRFIWDGHMWAAGVNPFGALPTEVVGTLPGLTPELMAKMNSPTHYTIYPLVCQATFWLSVLISPESELGAIIVMRSLLILADVGTIYLLLKLTEGSRYRNAVWLYALNPLVVLELVGNLHYEGLMMFFVVLTIYLLKRERVWWSAVALGAAVLVKLIPLIFIPFLIRRIGFFKTMIYGVVVLGIFMLGSLPFFGQSGPDHFLASFNLYFQNFEFNASIYYLIRWVGYQAVGYNIIALAGKLLSLSVFLLIIGLAWKNRARTIDTLASNWAAALLIYLLLATIVHPWYVIPVLLLSLMRGYNYALVWSGVVFLSYSAYADSNYTENLWLVAIEYVVLAGAVVHDLWRKGSVGGTDHEVV